MTEIFSVRGGRLFSLGVWTLVGGIVFLWCGLLYFDFSPSGYNIKRVVQSGWFLLIFILLLQRGVRKEINQVLLCIPPASLLLITAAIVAGIISSFLAEYPYKGIQEVSLYSLLFLGVLFIAGSNLSNKQIVIVIACMGAGVTLYFYGFLFQYAVHIQYPPGAWMHTTYQFSNPRSLNHAQNWLIPLFSLLPVFSAKYSGIVKGLSWAPVVLMYFFLFLTSGRGLTLALLVTFVGSYCLFRKGVVPLLRVHLYSSMIGLLIYLLLVQCIPAILGHGFDVNAFRELGSGISSLDRLQLWKKALEVFSDHPWFGNGPQHYILKVNGPGSPHNHILQWLSEWGAVATACFLGAVFIVVFNFFNLLNKAVLNKSEPLSVSDKENRLITICLLMGIASAFFHSQISGVFITPMSQMLMVLVFGISLARFKRKQKKQKFQNKWLTNTFYGGIFFLGVSYFAIFYWEFLAENYPVALFMESAAPRFWQNGAFPLHLQM